LLIFAKSPESGQVKTRIAEQTGPRRAAEIYEEMLMQMIRESAANDQWERLVSITPESDASYFHHRGLHTLRQRGNGLGERMANALLDSLKSGIDKTIMIGSDIPTLTQAELRVAFEELTDVQAVIGPSEDGGFYLLGISKKRLVDVWKLLRQPIHWSTSTVLPEMERLCRKYQLTLRYLPGKRDIDTYEDWLSYQNRQR
jgi:rSAM/selenodomain-associated transferase 1